MSNSALTQSKEWRALRAHHDSLKTLRTQTLFDQDPARFGKFHIENDGLLFDYSKHPITEETRDLLIQLAKAVKLEEWRGRMFAGAPVNTSENRAALHTALRGGTDKTLEVNGENVSVLVRKTLEQLKSFSTEIRENGEITDVVNIGIGGSHLGPHAVCESLKHISDGPRVHFVSNVDGAQIAQTLSHLAPQTTLLVISSKTFTTIETLINARTAYDWLTASLDKEAAQERMVAVTGNRGAAEDFGVHPENILFLPEWVGGRYSLWSAIGLPIAIAAGFETFQALLNGARAMDTHFKTARLHENMPVIMGLLGLWHINFYGRTVHAILPYAQNLHRLPAYIQQLDMESNGKSVDRDGQRVDYATGPTVFGEPGTDAQHAFFQLLHQGTHIIPADFILAAESGHALDEHHRQLSAAALAQTQALMQGRDNKEAPHRHFEGNRPVSTLILKRLDAYHLGQLLALYEHKVFVQGILWNLNSFDQWGVELGKVLARDILKEIENGTDDSNMDPSTHALSDIALKPFIKS